MAWTTLPSYTDGTVLTAAMLLAIRDNINATAPALASIGGSTFIGTGPNAIVERYPIAGTTPAAQSTTNTASFTDLATVGPSAGGNTGTRSIVGYGAQIENTSASNGGAMSFGVSGATTIASNAGAVALRLISASAGERNSGSVVNFMNGLTPGNNTFTAKYLCVGGTTATFQFRELWLFPL